MTHFAVFCPPFLSHVRALEAVAEALVQRGHRATLVHHADVGTLVRSRSLGFQALGAATHPPGSLAGIVARAGQATGPVGLLRLVHDVSRSTAMLCREGPDMLRRIGAEAVIADQMEPAGGLVAESLGLPYVSVACALPINREPDVPLPFLSWAYDPSEAGRRRNRGGERVSDLLIIEHTRTIERCAAALSLSRRRSLEDCLSPYAQISQMVAGFEFPRSSLPENFHFVGPLRTARERGQNLMIQLDPDRPFIFASLGTLQGGRIGIFKAVAQACRRLDAQLLVAHCGALSQAQAESIGATWVTDFAPQQAVLARASVAVTHAGLNTALDALTHGVPMLAIPIAFDQPGVAARIVHTGVGNRLSRRFLTPKAVEAALQNLLSDDRFRKRVQALGREAESPAAAAAADIIEAVVRTRAPVRAA